MTCQDASNNWYKKWEGKVGVKDVKMALHVSSYKEEPNKVPGFDPSVYGQASSAFVPHICKTDIAI